MAIKKLIISNKIDQLDIIQQFLEELGMEWQLEKGLIFELNLVLEEYFTNLINYGYNDRDDHDITVEISIEEMLLKIIITDDSNSFNILELPENEEIGKPVEERRIGGLGVHFIKKLTDYLEYQSDGEKNRLVVLKRLDSYQKSP
jgi:serine/threonine-protein kinase RsbW